MYINETLDNGRVKNIAVVCDFSKVRVERTEDTTWFEPTRTHPSKLNIDDYDLFTCNNCQRDFAHSALNDPDLRWNWDVDRDGVYSFYCGECGFNDMGFFTLQRTAHGMMKGHRMTDEKFSIPHIERIVSMPSNAWGWTSDTVKRYKAGLRHRMEEWLGKTDTARTLEFSLFDMFRNDDGAWCVKVPTESKYYEDGFRIVEDADEFVAFGFNRFMDYFSARYTSWSAKYNRYGRIERKREFRPSETVDFRLTVYDWRKDDDAIGGWSSPILFRIEKKSYYYDDAHENIVVLCNEESVGRDDDWDNETCFNPQDLFHFMLKEFHYFE